jgi:hypothetical protein
VLELGIGLNDIWTPDIVLDIAVVRYAARKRMPLLCKAPYRVDYIQAPRVSISIWTMPTVAAIELDCLDGVCSMLVILQRVPRVELPELGPK